MIKKEPQRWMNDEKTKKQKKKPKQKNDWKGMTEWEKNNN